ncbi:energy-coupling factor transporter transmembrane component T [Thioclava dalianensis]|nr:energy-coupling factor transporter transmembrane component T [Thioclava dalianensis]
MSAGTKLVMLCVFCTTLGVMRMVATGWLGLGVVLIAATVPGLWFVRLILRDLRGSALIAVVIVGFQWLSGRLDLGLAVAGTLLACVAAAMMLSRTTSPADLLDVLDRWLGRIGLPARPRRRLSLAIALTLRFIPALSARAALLSEAHRARSPRRVGWRLVGPLALGTLDEADTAAEALRARAFLE